MEIVEIFEDVISRAKLALKVNSDAELAELLGMTPTAFSNRKRTKSVPYERLNAALSSRNVDLKWVLTGNPDTTSLRDASLVAAEAALHYSPVGQALLQEMQEAAYAEHLTPAQLIERFKDRLPSERYALNAGKTEKAETPHAFSEYQLIPRGSVRSSTGDNVIESNQLVDYVAFKREWMRKALGIAHSDIAVVEVRGDSMADTLCDGDLVLVDLRQNRLDVSALFVLKDRDVLVVRRVQRNLDGSITIKSDNTHYDAVTVKEPLNSLHVLGQVVWPRLR